MNIIYHALRVNIYNLCNLQGLFTCHLPRTVSVTRLCYITNERRVHLHSCNIPSPVLLTQKENTFISRDLHGANVQIMMTKKVDTYRYLINEDTDIFVRRK